MSLTFTHLMWLYLSKYISFQITVVVVCLSSDVNVTQTTFII